MENISEIKRKRGRPEKVSLDGVVINELVRSSDQIGLINPEIKNQIADGHPTLNRLSDNYC